MVEGFKSYCGSFTWLVVPYLLWETCSQDVRCITEGLSSPWLREGMKIEIFSLFKPNPWRNQWFIQGTPWLNILMIRIKGMDIWQLEEIPLAQDRRTEAKNQKCWENPPESALIFVSTHVLCCFLCAIMMPELQASKRCVTGLESVGLLCLYITVPESILYIKVSLHSLTMH